MNKPTKALTMPSDPLAILSMQNLDERVERKAREKREREQAVLASQETTPPPPEADSGEQNQPLTQVSNQVSNQVSKELSTRSNEGLSDDVSKEVTTPPIDHALTHGSDTSPARISRPQSPGRRQTPSPVEDVPLPRPSLARSLGKADREAVVRLSIDVPQGMYDRLKSYVHDKKIDSTRALTLALYEDFLSEEGY